MGAYPLLYQEVHEERHKNNDPRPSILERYPTPEAYLSRVTEAALQLRAEGFLLESDVVAILNQAARRRIWSDR